MQNYDFDFLAVPDRFNGQRLGPRERAKDFRETVFVPGNVESNTVHFANVCARNRQTSE